MTKLAAGAKRRSVALTWGLPADTGGAKITGYAISWKPKGACPNSKVAPAAGQMQAKGNAGGATVAGLANECAYTFTVVASNVAGAGGPASVDGTPTADQPPAPAPPTAATEHAGAQTTVTWGEPELEGQTEQGFYLVAIDGQGNKVPLPPVGAGARSANVPATANGGAGTLVLGRNYTFTLAVATTKPGATAPITSPQSKPSNAVEVFAGPSALNVSKTRIGPQAFRFTVQATWQGKVGQISAAGAATGVQDGAGPVTYDVNVPWGQSANVSFSASIPSAPDAPAQTASRAPTNPLPQFTSGPQAVWGPCSNNPDISGDKVHENGYWTANVDFGGEGAREYSDNFQSTWAYAYGTNQPSPTQGNEGFGTPPTQMLDGIMRTNGRRHEDQYTFFVQFRFRVQGYGWVTSTRTVANSPDCAGD
ncbi:fibronectin type III domain-containing protein [Aquihabitans sp. G128]|uniref:fibronectin type III domain-containing protein n=1 Tax=Aquihabitans sp. G128 TaxID=2849779 RepID=UPI001C2192BD|nr:fibronectin type III domain-containing protein [Aquihabitans sp. G128]QXC63151.1 fibronectin type III domain-containing protein [Aquihabitans sp. G128]